MLQQALQLAQQADLALVGAGPTAMNILLAANVSVINQNHNKYLRLILSFKIIFLLYDYILPDYPWNTMGGEPKSVGKNCAPNTKNEEAVA